MLLLKADEPITWFSLGNPKKSLVEEYLPTTSLVQHVDNLRTCVIEQVLQTSGIAEELKGEVNQNQNKQTIADPF